MDTSGAPIGGGVQPIIVTVAEVASLLRCSKAHVHNLIAGRVRGLTPLPAVALGRRRVIRRQALELWLEESEIGVAMIRSSPNIDAADP